MFQDEQTINKGSFQHITTGIKMDISHNEQDEQKVEERSVIFLVSIDYTDDH